MSILHPENINLAVPLNDIDKIIGILSGSFSVAQPTAISSPKSATDTQTTGFNDTCFYQGIYSVDSGTTWNDFGTMVPNLTTPANPVFQTVLCDGYSLGNTFVANGTNWYDLVHSSGTAYTILYKVALIAKNSQTSIIPIATNENLKYLAKYNNWKIYTSDIIPFNTTSGSSKTAVVTHPLGYVPRVRAYYQETSGSLRMQTVNQRKIETKITASDVTFFIDSVWATTTTGNIEYRIYLES